MKVGNVDSTGDPQQASSHYNRMLIMSCFPELLQHRLPQHQQLQNGAAYKSMSWHPGQSVVLRNSQ